MTRALILLKTWHYISRLLTYLLTYLGSGQSKVVTSSSSRAEIRHLYIFLAEFQSSITVFFLGGWVGGHLTTLGTGRDEVKSKKQGRQDTKTITR